MILPRRLMCPFAGVIYRDVPGYREGYGCPVCKGISINGHLLMTEPVVVPPSLGLDEECYRTAKHLGVNGCQKAVRWHVDDVITDIENDRRYFTCPGCDKPFVLAIGLLDTQIAREKTRRIDPTNSEPMKKVPISGDVCPYCQHPAGSATCQQAHP